MIKLLAALTFLSIAFAFSCAEKAATSTAANNAAAPNVAKVEAPSPTPDDAPRISLADAKKDYDAGKVVIVDVRNETDYAAEHIKGALNIPSTMIDANADKLPKGKKIIAYCS